MIRSDFPIRTTNLQRGLCCEQGVPTSSDLRSQLDRSRRRASKLKSNNTNATVILDELISFLEAGLGLECAHKAMFTSLSVVLSKYNPDRVMEHLKLFWARINMPGMIRACEEAHLWPELIFLYCHDDEWDKCCSGHDRALFRYLGTSFFQGYHIQSCLMSIDQIRSSYKAFRPQAHILGPYKHAWDDSCL